MKTVVITGSARGFGLCLAKKFKEANYNVVISDVNMETLEKAKEELMNIKTESKILAMSCNVTSHDDVLNLWNASKNEFGNVDIWINNAGVNSPNKGVYEFEQKEIDFILDVDLKGAIYGSKIAFKGMKEQGFGQIYNVEGYGSTDQMMTGLTMYGTAKRAVTYFTKSLMKESHDLTNDNVKVCLLTPGIMITNFITSANGDKTKVELSEKTKKVYNILGDYPETIANYVVPRMIKNNKNGYNVIWLTNSRAFKRFMFASFNKRDFFK